MNCLKILALMPLFSLFAGCATMDKYYEERRLLMNPQRMNETTFKGTNAWDAMQVPVAAYYMAMDAAKTDYYKIPALRAEPRVIYDYVDAGIVLTNTYCRQWFHRITDKERGLSLTGKNINIIRDLGTVALGMMSASPAVVTAYGALNTAYSGFQDNFSSALLTAPAQRKVQVKISEMMAGAAGSLRESAQSLTFPQAYDRLSGYAEICTFGTIQEAVDQALSSTETVVVPLTGKIITNSK